MSLTTKNHLNIVVQTFKKLLSFKADKSELEVLDKNLTIKLNAKIDRSEIEEEDAIILSIEMGLISPVAADDGSIYIDENNIVYTL